MIKLLKYLAPYKWLFVLVMLLTFGQTFANLTLPDYMARIVDKGVIGQNSGVIYHNGIIMLLVTLAGGICTVGVGYLAAKIGTGFAKNIRDMLFTKVEGFSLIEFNKFSTASLITRCTNDIQQIQNVYIMIFRMALMAPFMGIIAIIKAYHLAPSMTWIMVVSVTALVIIIAAIFSVAIPKFKRLQKLIDKLNLVMREILTGLRVIRAFNKEKHEEEKFSNANRELTDIGLFVTKLMALMQPVMILIMNFTLLAVVWVGAHQIDMGTLAVGDMLAYMQYAMQAIFAFLLISIIFIMVPRASVSALRIAEVLEARASINDPEFPLNLPRQNGIVEFKDVTFAYEGSEEPVLFNISFTALPGETTALVGSTGSGKSTIVNLIPRFYDVTGGQILVNGVDVRDIKQDELRSCIGYVSQRAMLFSGPVKDNINYADPDMSQDEVEQAAVIAQAHEFISQLEKAYDSPVAQAGVNISGGQKQRLAIARAVAKKPEIFIFDDSFSALDFNTDAALRKALQKKIKGKTILIVAQRINTIMNAEKIIVLDSGRIVGQGTHVELLRTCKVYREIALSQLSEEELLAADNEQVRNNNSGLSEGNKIYE